MNGITVNIGWEYFLGIMVSLIVIAWRFGVRFTELEISVGWIKAELKKHWSVWKGHQKDIGELKKDFGNLRLSIAGLSEGKSPLSPTKKGWKFLKESGLVEIIDKTHKDWLLNKLKKSLPPKYTGYEVQGTARQVMAELENSPMMVKAKEYSFNNGISLDLLLMVGGLLLRDNFLGWKHKIAK
ncbi:MAG TPA: hypothetical protein ENI23_17215 [bacterium]|nr:hypothetical protein [bacterium]